MMEKEEEEMGRRGNWGDGGRTEGGGGLYRRPIGVVGVVVDVLDGPFAVCTVHVRLIEHLKCRSICESRFLFVA
jgi:hypothetical protein